MSLFSLIAALLLEQLRPLDGSIQPYRLFTRYANHLERLLNAGERKHGIIAWCVAVLPPMAAVALLHTLLYSAGSLLAWAFGAAVLYLSMGFRQVIQTAGEVAQALKDRDIDRARRLVGQWQARSAEDFDEASVARVTIEQTLLGAHRQLFGIIFWFVVLGPAGAVFYRGCQMLAQKWGSLEAQEFGDFGTFSAQMFEAVDWIPARLTAGSFAIVGDFEDAVYCWRTQAATWTASRLGTVLASGAGALGVRLGEPLSYAGTLEFRPELGLGDEPDGDFIDSALGLVWRALMLWLVLITLLTLASWAG